jgi:tetratricopeptide (TPR) repeat protein
MGAYNLADVINQQLGDLVKAEELARESLRILSLINDINHYRVGRTCNLLANILRMQGQLGDETRGLYEHYLANSIQNGGPDGLTTASGNFNLGLVYHQRANIENSIDSKQTQLLLANSHFEEALRIYSKTFGPTHAETVKAVSQWMMFQASSLEFPRRRKSRKVGN